jgi:hypothetical protein
MARHGISLGVATLVAALASDIALARDETRAIVAAIGDAIESCVDSTAIRFGGGESRVILDAADTATVGTALLRRYPAFAQSGFAPQAIVLWRKPAADWLYVSLLVNPAKPGEVCFTATFVAARLEMTPAMLKKYFGVES